MLEKKTTQLSGFAANAGKVLAISYPVLALSTGVRALYQLLAEKNEPNFNLLASSLSGIAAICYLIATVGFTIQKKWAWWLSVLVLGFEILMVIVIGIWSFVDPLFIGRTVWGHFGADYAFFPLIQPLIGLIWLLHPTTRRVYQI